MTHTPRKRFGQNFLIDNNIVENLIAAVHPRAKQHIIEIGPGTGALTSALIASGATIDAIEIDRDLAQDMQNRFMKYPNFKLHCMDILKFPLNQLTIKSDDKLRIVGNLPYNISTPLLFKLFAELAIIKDMFFMLQREVALRLIAKPNTKEYGRMSIMAQFYCDMHIILDVPPSAFHPQPKVHSSIVKFTPYAEPPVHIVDHLLLQNIVTHAFSHRRKTITNSLKDFLRQDELQQLHINPQLRAENLSLMDYANIANYLANI